MPRATILSIFNASLAAALATALACASGSRPSADSTAGERSSASNGVLPASTMDTAAGTLDATPVPLTDAQWADSVLKTLSLRDKAAQMVWIWTLGDFAPADAPSWTNIERLIREQRLGGAIISVGGPTDIAVKTNALQRAAQIPLLLGADLETGAGFRARGGWFLPNAIELGGATSFPYPMAIGATRDTMLAYEMGRVTAVEGRAMGLHMAFAPVLDVNNNPKNPVISARSFGEDPALVSAMGRAFIRGVQEHGMLATGKHFPGHGDTEQNSHLELSRVNVSRARLDSVELRPFRDAIAAGVRGMMTFHGDLPALDPSGTAATLSPKVMIDLLRKEMGFKGILVTDALDMNGVLGKLSMGEATQRAVIAGNDVLLMPTDVRVAIDAVVAGVRAGRYTEARIDSSVHKLLMAKHEFGLHRNRFVNVEAVREVAGVEANMRPARLAAERSITLARDPSNLVPLKLARTARVVSITVSSRNELSAGRAFDAELRGMFPQLLSLSLSPEVVYDATAGAAAGGRGYSASPSAVLLPASVENAVRLSRNAQVVLVSSYVGATSTTATIRATGGLAELISALRRGGAKVVLVSFANPYLAQGLPQTEAHLLAWSPYPIAQRAAARALMGRAPITGTLPVTIPGVAAYGAGIRR
jgi:beta-N-acetylhexosaminidase